MNNKEKLKNNIIEVELNDGKKVNANIVFTFEDNTDLRYHDTRKFGRMNLIKKEDINNIEALNKQGFEPNSKQLTKEYLYNKIKYLNLYYNSI